MSTRYIVGPGQEFTYPADKDSLKLIQVAGGASQLKGKPYEQDVKFKTVKEGEDCSDMPPSSLAVYVERGWVVPAEAPTDEQQERNDEAGTAQAKPAFDGVDRRGGGKS